MLAALTVIAALLVACDYAERGDSGQIINSGNLDVEMMQLGD
jgi:hypothetical protein